MSLSIDQKQFSSFHITGILGSGMSAIAQFLAWSGCTVCGSDRALDKEDTGAVQTGLAAAGCTFAAQDGSGISAATGAVVLSTAIEESNPDIAAARRLGIPLVHRSDVLAAIVAQHETVAVAGTSGKSTVSALCFELLTACGKSPSLITGAPLKRLAAEGYIGNAYKGTSRLLVVEADESDGTLVKYHPALSVILNVSKDHKPVDETMELFAAMCRQSGAVIVNADDALVAGLPHQRTFGLTPAADVYPDQINAVAPMVSFERNGVHYSFPQIGQHNLQNLLAAVAVGEFFGCRDNEMAKAAGAYEGLDRRFTVAGVSGGVTVVDDYAHNPAKIKAALKAAQTMGGRVCAIFQPHGFGPTRFMRAELVETLSSVARKNDAVALMPIYYAGGTAQKDIASSEIAAEIQGKGKDVWAPQSREECCSLIASWARKGDVVLLMGARDPSLPAFARQIVEALRQVPAA